MADERTRIEKLRAMANQTASPNEAAVAREKLAELEGKPVAGVQVFVKEWRYVDLAAGKAVSTPDLLTATQMWARQQGIKVEGGFLMRSDDIKGVIRVSFRGIQGERPAVPFATVHHMQERSSTGVRYQPTTASNTGYFGGIDFGGRGQSPIHAFISRRESRDISWKAAMAHCICGNTRNPAGAVHSTVCAQARAAMASQAGY